jgi:glycerophosphoryl diester phosphodiesterase
VRLPSEEERRRCKIIAHRGVHDGTDILENTLAAFEKAEAAGVWGIECDIRWTRDGIPVVIHDPDLGRVFGLPVAINQVTFQELQSRCARVPSLETVVDRFGGRLHLMIEIKLTANGASHKGSDRLQDILSSLQPVRDYHLMTLHPQALAPFTRIPREAFAAIAYDLPRRYSDWVRRNGWGAICGHYLLMTAPRVQDHQHRGQRVGTGYAAAPNVLYREINRGIDWIFSNHADVMQRHLCRMTSPAKSTRDQPDDS